MLTYKIVEFLDKFEDIVLNETKQKTTRLITTDYFNYYSEFMYRAHRFVIDSVERKSTKEACAQHYAEEMFASADDMYTELKNIYKDKVTEDSQCFVISFHMIY